MRSALLTLYSILMFILISAGWSKNNARGHPIYYFSMGDPEETQDPAVMDLSLLRCISDLKRLGLSGMRAWLRSSINYEQNMQIIKVFCMVYTR